jgi:uncharacterized membrane protein
MNELPTGTERSGIRRGRDTGWRGNVESFEFDESTEGRQWGDGNGVALDGATRRARGLGWFSIGLGASQVLAPRAVARLTGVGDTWGRSMLMRLFGLREITAGVGILSGRRSGAWVWARFFGDIIDLATLGSALRSRKARRARVAESIGAVAGVTLLDYLTARQLSHRDGRRRREDEAAGTVEVAKTITVNAPAAEVYLFWRDFENLPRFMAHLENVEVQDDRRSRWTAKGPAGKPVTWEAEITEERPSELIAWRSLPGSDVSTSGVVRFLPAPGGRGTIVRVDMTYDPPAGKLGAAIAKLFGKEPGQQVEGDLRRFKQVVETGEVINSDASIHAGRHPAQPPEEVPPNVAANLNANWKGATR